MLGRDNPSPRPSREESEGVVNFEATVDSRCKSVQKGCTTAYVMEWEHAVDAASKMEHVMYSRVWM